MGIKIRNYAKLTVTSTSIVHSVECERLVLESMPKGPLKNLIIICKPVRTPFILVY